MNKKIINIIGYIAMPLLFIFDIVSKYVIEAYLLSNGKDVVIIKNFFNLTLHYNDGAFSGFLSFLNNDKFPVGTFILLLLSIAGVVGGIIVLIKKRKSLNLLVLIGIFLLIPGAAGNLIDRFLTVCGLQEGVIDFLHFYNLPIIGDFNVFNFADSYLTISIVIIIAGYIYEEIKNKNNKENKEVKNG